MTPSSVPVSVRSQGIAASAAYALLKSATTCAETGAMIAPLMGQLVWTTEALTPEEPTSPVMVPLVQVTAPPWLGAALRMAKLDVPLLELDEPLLVRAFTRSVRDEPGDDPQARRDATRTRPGLELRGFIQDSNCGGLIAL